MSTVPNRRPVHPIVSAIEAAPAINKRRYRLVDRVDPREPGSSEPAREIIEASALKLLARADAVTDSAELSPEARAMHAARLGRNREFWSDSQNAARRILGLGVGFALYASPTAPVLLLCAGLLAGGEIKVECVEDSIRITRIKAPASIDDRVSDELATDPPIPAPGFYSIPLAGHNGTEGDLASEGVPPARPPAPFNSR